MTAAPVTRTTTALLCGLGDPDNQLAWHQLVDRCAPIMRGVALRLGLDSVDADDLVQSALMTFLEAWRRGQYDRRRGRLSAFMVTILRSRIADWRRRSGRRHEMVPMRRLGDAAIDPPAPSTEDLEAIWSDERQGQILARALDRLRNEGVDERTITAFEMYAIRGITAERVAANLGLSRAEVYNVKYRLTRRLQPIVARLDEIFEDL